MPAAPSTWRVIKSVASLGARAARREANKAGIPVMHTRRCRTAGASFSPKTTQGVRGLFAPLRCSVKKRDSDAEYLQSI